MLNKKIVSISLVIVGIIFLMLIFKSLFPIIFFLISMLGWVFTGVLIISLTGLQNKILKSFNQKGLVVSKKIKIPFVGEAEISSVSGTEIMFKLKRK